MDRYAKGLVPGQHREIRYSATTSNNPRPIGMVIPDWTEALQQYPLETNAQKF